MTFEGLADTCTGSIFWVYFQKSSGDSETSDMTSEGLGEMFEGYSAETSAGKLLLTLMGVLALGSTYARPGSKDPHRRAWGGEPLNYFIVSTLNNISFCAGFLSSLIWKSD